MNAQDIVQLKLTSNSALKLVIDDDATAVDYTMLQGAFSVAVMADKLFYQSHQSVLNLALSLATEAAVFLETNFGGKVTMEAHEKATLAEAVHIHDCQLDNMTNEDLSKVLKKLDSELKYKAKHA